MKARDIERKTSDKTKTSANEPYFKGEWSCIFFEVLDYWWFFLYGTKQSSFSKRTFGRTKQNYLFRGLDRVEKESGSDVSYSIVAGCFTERKLTQYVNHSSWEAVYS